MSTLFIIGNGFDIWNRLPTSYKNFHEKYKEHLNEHTHYFDDFCGDDSEWANFEESLGSFNQDDFHENAVPQPSLEELADDHTILYGYEDEISIKKEALVEDMTNAFNEWIRSVDLNPANKLIQFNPSAFFVNFNYTKTLQVIYEVPESNILHIHGEVDKKIIFGHGRNVEETEEEHQSDNPWFDEATKEVGEVLGIFHKPVDKILDEHRVSLEGQNNIESIVVIGHSVNEIDIPYFQCILNAYPDANWKNYNYQNMDEDIDEVSATHDKLLDLGISNQQLESYPSERLEEIYPLS